MLASWDDFKGQKVVIDYKTSNNKIAFARGILDDYVEGKIHIMGTSRFWIIDKRAILVFRVWNGEKEEGEGDYLGGEAT